MTSIHLTQSSPPFLLLSKEQRSAVSAELRDAFMANSDMSEKEFAGHFKEALLAVRGKESQDSLSKGTAQVLNALNDRALHILNDKVQEWQIASACITGLTPLLQMSGKVILCGGIVTAGIGLSYLRSQKLIALACGCAAYALWVFRSLCLRLSASAQQLDGIISSLNYRNVESLDRVTGFSPQVDQVYEELKKTSYLIRFYLNAHQQKMKSDHQGLQLLREQLSAIHHLCFIGQSLFFRSDLPSVPQASTYQEVLSEQTIDLKKIEHFFNKFEALCRHSKGGAIGIGLLTIAWTYYAYIQRAYLMVVAGLAQFLFQAFLFKELRVFQKGSKNIRLSLAQNCLEKDLVIEFQKMAKSSSLFSKMGLQEANAKQIQQAVVIPFDGILKLIPSWKEA